MKTEAQIRDYIEVCLEDGVLAESALITRLLALADVLEDLELKKRILDSRGTL